MAKLTHGPLVGATTDSSACIWLRAVDAEEVEVRLSTTKEPVDDPKAVTAKAKLKGEHDFTAVLSFDSLQPDTTYYYTVLLAGQPALDETFAGKTTFRTFPLPDEEADSFTFAFGSCFIPEVHKDKIFKNLLREDGQLDPRFFLMIGDNIYADKHIELRNLKKIPPAESLLALYREAYRESWKHETFRHGLSQTPSYMIFDDHEIWNNWNNESVHQHDHEGSLAAKQAYWEYQDQHNPSAAARHQTVDDPTYHYTFSYGKDIGFFVLDCRMRRNPDAIPYRTILGEEQRLALFHWLKKNNTKYRVKFIVSSVPISFIALPHGIVNLLHGTLGDQWLGYPEERLDLFKFIQYEKIEGVHFLSGDIHLGQALVIESKEEGDGPPVYSYTSSPLANNFHLLPEEMPAWFGRGVSFVIAFLIGWLSARHLLNLTTGWSLVVGLLAGSVVAWLWKRRQERRDPQIKKKQGWIEEGLYWILKKIAHFSYMRKNMGVAADNIKGGGVHYVPDNLFEAVHNYNMGFVTIKRDPQDGKITVQYRVKGTKGEELGCEKDPHTV